MTSSRPDPPFVGRRLELAELEALVERAVAGVGGARTVVGPAGAGKTALLDQLGRAAAARGCRVVRTTGSEAEADLPWAALATICLGRPDLFDRLPGPQGHALRRALSLVDDGAGEDPDRLAVSLGALGVLSAQARELPLVLLVDDLQWTDPESRSALDFLGRRLGDDPIALITASRPLGPASSWSLPGVDPLVLDRLADAELADLLQARGVTAPAAVARVVELAAGSPLLAVQLARSLDAEERSGARPVPEELRVPAEVSDLYLGPLADLDERSRSALAVVAAASGADATPGSLLAALAELGLGVGDLEPAEERGLVALAAGTVRFTHPLARTAVYQGVPGAVRRRAHEALAVAEGRTSPRGVLHRAAAAVGPDAELAEALAGQADDALRRGAAMTAVSRFEQAASLAGTGDRRSDHLVAAARAALAAGEPRRARSLLDQVAADDAARARQLDVRRIEVRLAVAAGDLAAARAQVDEIDASFAATDPVAVAELIGEVVRPMLVSSPFDAVPFMERVWELTAGAGGRAARYAEVLHGCGRFLQGDGEGAARHTAGWRDLLDDEGPVVAGPFLAESLVLYQAFSNQAAAALQVLDEVEGQLRRLGASGALVSVLAARSVVTYSIDLRACVAAGREARQLAAESHQPGLSSAATATLAIAAATVGDEVLTQELCDQLLASPEEGLQVSGRAALARFHLVSGRPEGAVAQFALARDLIGARNDTFVPFEADEAEAFIRVGRIDDARAVVPALEANAATMGPWAVGVHERVLALLSEDVDDAERHFQASAEALVLSHNRIAQGVLELHWGERLRRAKRRADARRHLERAVDVFARVGATAFRRRAEEELAAAGGVGDRSRPTVELLGPVELQVARLAVAGATNRDIAGQLFVSPRTVENHLGAVYRKLSVTGRPGLLARSAEDPALRSMVVPAGDGEVGPA